MNAFTYAEYGTPEVLRPNQVPKPLPKDNEILVKIHASTVTSGAIWIRQGRVPSSKIFTFLMRLLFGITKPRKPILGFEFSGVVEEVGKAVTRFKTGDAVYGTTTGLPQGSYADYLCVPEARKQGVVALKPESLSFAEAAALPIGAMTALHLLLKANVSQGQNVLVYGASGSVGSFGVQIARNLGATVTGVCSTGNIAMVRSLGASRVLDYTTEDLWQCAEKFDVIFDAVGKLETSVMKRFLRQGGKFCTVKSPTSEKNEYLEMLHRMVAEGKLKPFIDKSYPFEQLADAHRYVDLGRKKGNIVITHS